MKYPELTDRAVELLKHLIATPSVSRSEEHAANVMEQAIRDLGFQPRREANNVWALDPHFDENRPTLLLNAHLDTVKPVATWTRNPYCPEQDGDVLYGLGSNDCGGGLVSLLQVFAWLTAKEQPYNVIYLASAEEEVSGKDGISRVLPLLPPVEVAIVGEPTGMQPAIAEKGLMVLDVVAHGTSGHAARGEGVNAIYEALEDLHFLHTHKFRKVSDLLGPTIMNVTMIHAGTQHNVVPDRCEMVVDIRTNEFYQNEFVFEFLKKHLKSEVTARSFRLHSSRIDPQHPIVRRCKSMGLKPFGSPTLSDQALMSFPSLKLGPGESSRSHSADEFIRISEIAAAIETYIRLLDQINIKGS
jgi:acetylornithine deacetylase